MNDLKGKKSLLSAPNLNQDSFESILENQRREMASVNGVDLNEDSFESILESQLREIADFKTLNSDSDYAFNLQMEEAITASISLVSPSSSTPQPKTDNVVSVVKSDDDVFDYMDLLLEDIERWDLEHRDKEACEYLMREMREDLDCRIHDQQLATEILRIPDVEWDENGDNYNKPYIRGSRLELVNNESFKVYCKGVESEEVVKDKKLIVGGVGVAVCDWKDNAILEVSKRVELDGKGKEQRSDEAVEIEAVIAGLDTALSLGLKKITFFCDDFMVYQYVTGRVQPNQNRVSTLVDQVLLLQKKFTDCNPSLVARNDVKFAFKLAGDAIVSQITWPAESGTGKGSLMETCVICYEDRYVGQMFSVDGCLHRYCFSCMKQHVEVKLLDGMEARCPHGGCKSEVSIDSCGKFLDPKLVEIISQRKKEASIAVTQKVYCPYSRCSALMSRSEVLEYTKAFYVGAEQSGARKCVKCQHFFCINCKVPWHYDVNCYDYKRHHPHPRVEDVMLASLAKNKLWRQCVECNHMVELAEGCYHITCRCGYEFCYTCGAPWKNKKPTCPCKIWDERNIIGGHNIGLPY